MSEKLVALWETYHTLLRRRSDNYQQAQEDGTIDSLALLAIMSESARTGTPDRYRLVWSRCEIEVAILSQGDELRVLPERQEVKVTCRGRVVCSTIERLFVPGTWLDELREALDVAREAAEREEGRRLRSAIAKLEEDVGPFNPLSNNRRTGNGS